MAESNRENIRANAAHLAQIARAHGFDAIVVHIASDVYADYCAIEIPWSRLLPDGSYETGTEIETVRTVRELRAALGY